ncbi:MAG: membrane protein insertase YidC [Opitutales bacterium]
MDKKNTILGLLFIGAGIGFMFWQASELQEQERQQALQPPVAVDSAEPMGATLQALADESAATTTEGAGMLDLLVQEVDAAALETKRAPRVAAEETVTLANEFIRVEFTNRGGAIRRVEFLKTKRGETDDFVFNDKGPLPALSLGLPNQDGSIQEFDMPYQIAAQSAHSITFILQAGADLQIRRTYALAQPGTQTDPYIIEHSTTFENRAATAKAFSTLYLNLGTMQPIADGAMQQSYLNVGYYNGADAKFKPITKLIGSSGFLGIGANAPRDELRIEDAGRIEWSSVKNQFFAAVLSTDQAVGQDLILYPVRGDRTAPAAQRRDGITGSVGYAFGTVAGGSAKTLEFSYYVGPKEFKRLQALGNDKDLVMQFGFLSFISKLLLSFMYAIHAVIPSWGLSIVVMTICIKLLFWPLTAQASRSQKRMASIQGPMAELKEKFKDNPQKMQQETLKLFREHQVNPVAGCLPILIQMPIFLGLFYMLRTASELRHESFLWVADLSQPDTLFEVAGFPINLLPLIMGVTMFLQMSMMPVNPAADPTQQKIFKFLPFVFLIFLYNFSSGLVLYWTVQNILTIVQQKITNSRPDPMPVAAAAGGNPSAKPKAKSGIARGKPTQKK